MTKRDRYSTSEIPGDENEAAAPFPSADNILPQGKGPGIPRRSDIAAQLQSENAELKEQLEQFQAMLSQRSNALDVQTSTFAVGDFLLTPTGLEAPEEFSFEDWEQIGHLIFRLEGAIQWLIGDWLVYGADLQYGDITQIADTMDRDVQTFYNIMTTCRGVESYRRREVLSFAHHSEVRKMTAENQTRALEFAEGAGYNVKQFRRWIKLGMPETGLPEALQASTTSPTEPRYNPTKLLDSAIYVSEQDLTRVPIRELKSAADAFDTVIQIATERRQRLLDAVEQRSKK